VKPIWLAWSADSLDEPAPLPCADPVFMRLVFIVLLGFLAQPAHAETTPPNSGTQLVYLCNRDLAECQQLIGIIIKTGIEAERLPKCASSLDLTKLTQDILNWWTLYPEKAENPVVLAVTYALRALKPC
jgi:hypothetical protein